MKYVHIIFLTVILIPFGLCQTASKIIKVEAYIIDKDPSGTNVRETPGGKVKTVLHFKDRCTLATPILINRSAENGWLFISTNDICVEKATGWVHTSLIYTSLNLKSIYNEKEDKIKVIPIYLFGDASKNATKTHKLTFEQEVNIVKSEGAWVYVKATDAYKKTVYGWLSPEDQCSNPFTTCSP